MHVIDAEFINFDVFLLKKRNLTSDVFAEIIQDTSMCVPH